MSSEKYATEENIRSLIVLIREELNNYVTKDEFNTGSYPGVDGDYVTRYEMDEILSNYVRKDELGSDGEVPSYGSTLTYEKVYALPEYGEPNVIYLMDNGGDGTNKYDEYFWDNEEGRFELIGPVGGSMEESGNYITWSDLTQQLETILSDIPKLSFEKVYSLPDSGQANTIYLVYNDGSDGSNMFDEYIYDVEEARFERLGSLTLNEEHGDELA